MKKLIPLYFKDLKRQKIVWGAYNVKHREHMSFYHYFLKQKSPKLVTKKTSSLIGNKTLGKKPQGFIFHGGRTGSTLFARMLKSIVNVEVFSEVDLITQVLNNKDSYSKKEMEVLLKKTIESYLDCVGEGKKCYFKFTSLDTLALPLLRKYYPDVPMVYLFDSPERILSSQFLRPPRWAHESLNLAQKNGYKRKVSEKNNLLAERIKAQSYLLNKAFSIVLKNKEQPNFKIISYQDLFLKNIIKIYKHLNLKVTTKDLEKINIVKTIDAKNPSKKFSKKVRVQTTPLLMKDFFYQPDRLEQNYQKLKLNKV